MNPFFIDRTDQDDAARTLRAILVVSIVGALLCIAAYFGSAALLGSPA